MCTNNALQHTHKLETFFKQPRKISNHQRDCGTFDSEVYTPRARRATVEQSQMKMTTYPPAYRALEAAMNPFLFLLNDTQTLPSNFLVRVFRGLGASPLTHGHLDTFQPSLQAILYFASYTILVLIQFFLGAGMRVMLSLGTWQSRCLELLVRTGC